MDATTLIYPCTPPPPPPPLAAETASAQDLGRIFRIITGSSGSKLRDVDDEGNLIEQIHDPSVAIGGPGGSTHGGGEVAMLRREMRAELAQIKESIAGLSSLLTAAQHAPGSALSPSAADSKS